MEKASRWLLPSYKELYEKQLIRIDIPETQGLLWLEFRVIPAVYAKYDGGFGCLEVTLLDDTLPQSSFRLALEEDLEKDKEAYEEFIKKIIETKVFVNIYKEYIAKLSQFFDYAEIKQEGE